MKSMNKPHTNQWVAMFPYALLLPALVFALVFKVYPIAYSFFSSFHFRGMVSTRTYTEVFMDGTFWNALWTTIKLNLIMTPLQIAVAFVMAMLINMPLRGIGVYRSLMYLPVTVSMPVTAICWSMILNYNSGIVNSFITQFFGIGKQGFFTDVNQSFWCIVLLCSWKGCGYWMMFFLAGLKGVDESLYEAAMVDGAGFFRKLFSITIPLIKKTTLFVTVANTSINLLLFAPMKLITNGGPRNSTNVLMYEAYQQAFKYGSYEKGSAIASVLVVIALIIVFVQFRLMNEKE